MTCRLLKMSYFLPPEVWLEVFRYQSTPDLHRLSLVCRSFSFLALPLLYHHIRWSGSEGAISGSLRSMKMVEGRSDLLWGARSCVLSNWQAESELAAVATDNNEEEEDLPPVTTAPIQLVANAAFHPWHWAGPPVPPPRIPPPNPQLADIVMTIRKMSNLRHLEFCEVYIPNDFLSIVRSFEKLTSLALKACRIGELVTPHDWTPKALPLVSLSLTGSYWPSPGVNVLNSVATLALARGLKHLHVDPALLPSVLWAYSQPTPEVTLETLKIAVDDETRTSFLQAIVLPPFTDVHSVTVYRMPQSTLLPEGALPLLRSYEGPSHVLEQFVRRRQVDTIKLVDNQDTRSASLPVSPPSPPPFEVRQVTDLVERLVEWNVDVKSLDIRIGAWDDEIIYLLRELTPGLTELSVACTTAAPNEYFFISFAATLLPSFPNLRKLHIYHVNPAMSRSFDWQRAVLLGLERRSERGKTRMTTTLREVCLAPGVIWKRYGIRDWMPYGPAVPNVLKFVGPSLRGNV